METNLILLEENQGIATITLNRPEKRNALNQPLIQEFLNTLKSLAQNEAVRVVILQGKGDNFCAGGDIQNMQEIANASQSDNIKDAELLAELLFQLYHMPKPTMGLARGASLGGGLGLLCACDIVLAEQTAIFGFPEVKIGIAPVVISPYVIAAMGESAAYYHFLTGERFDVKEAYRIGLVHQINDDLSNTSLMLAKCLLQNGPQAMRAAKKIIREVLNQPVTQELAKQTAHFLAELRKTDEAQEGLKAFLEKRKPTWR